MVLEWIQLHSNVCCQVPSVMNTGKRMIDFRIANAVHALKMFFVCLVFSILQIFLRSCMDGITRNIYTSVKQEKMMCSLI